MSDTPSLPEMPPEIIQTIFRNLCDVQSVLRLAQTSKQFHAVLESPSYVGSKRKLEILWSVVETQFSPILELSQLAALKHDITQHISVSKPLLTMAFIKTCVAYGTTAEKWADLYPQILWRLDQYAQNRRQLRSHERQRLRQAIYRWWIYSKTFHQVDVPTSRVGRYDPRPNDYNDLRLKYVRQFDGNGIIELWEVIGLIHDYITHEICPDNTTIQDRYDEIFPGEDPLYFGSYETHPYNHRSRIEKPRGLRDEMVGESWGNRGSRNRKVREIMKLDPDNLFHFCMNLQNKEQREKFLVEILGTLYHIREGSICFALEAVTEERDPVNALPAPGVHDTYIYGGIIDCPDDNQLIGEKISSDDEDANQEMDGVLITEDELEKYRAEEMIIVT